MLLFAGIHTQVLYRVAVALDSKLVKSLEQLLERKADGNRPSHVNPRCMSQNRAAHVSYQGNAISDLDPVTDSLTTQLTTARSSQVGPPIRVGHSQAFRALKPARTTKASVSGPDSSFRLVHLVTISPSSQYKVAKHVFSVDCESYLASNRYS